MLLCGESDGSVDHVCCSTNATKLTGRTSGFIVKWLDLDDRRCQQAREPHLFSPIAPQLAHDSRRNTKVGPQLKGARYEDHDAPVASLKGDQRTCI
jgi:hypothetical protein